MTPPETSRSATTARAAERKLVQTAQESEQGRLATRYDKLAANCTTVCPPLPVVVADLSRGAKADFQPSAAKS